MREEGIDGELRPWHYINVYSIESKLIMRVIYESKSRYPNGVAGAGVGRGAVGCDAL